METHHRSVVFEWKTIDFTLEQKEVKNIKTEMCLSLRVRWFPWKRWMPSYIGKGHLSFPRKETFLGWLFICLGPSGT